MDAFILEQLEFLAASLPKETDWLVIKTLLLRMLPPATRTKFTTRDPVTKKHYPFNELENEIREAWMSLTGLALDIDPEKALTPNT